MPNAIDDVFNAAAAFGKSATVTVTLVTNQSDGIASYTTGRLRFHPAEFVGWVYRFERLSTTGANPLAYTFSNRFVPAGEVSPGVPILSSQPFDIDQSVRLGLSLTRSRLGGTPYLLKCTLIDHGNVAFAVPLEINGDVLVGVGPPVGNRATQAVYVVALSDVLHDPA